MDPRSKLILMIVYMVVVFMADSFFSYIYVALMLALMISCSRLPLKTVVKTVKPVLILVVLTAIINLLFISEGNVVFSWWIITVTDGGLIFAGKMVLRLVFLVMGSSILTLTTTPVDLTHALESLLKPLNAIKFPVYMLALIMSIALKSIPILMDETDRIIRAQKSRGADFDTGGIIKRAKAFIPVLIPLLISALRSADELASAMDSRCFGYTQNRTKMKRLKFTKNDIIGTLVMVAIITVMLYFKYSKGVYGEVMPWMYV